LLRFVKRFIESLLGFVKGVCWVSGFVQSLSEFGEILFESLFRFIEFIKVIGDLLQVC
jgi:hypothetical protein